MRMDAASSLTAGRLARVASFLVVMMAVVRCIWICDDACITMRTVDNFLHGYGMTWNPPERVQVFTHPLWFLVLIVSDALSPSSYWSVAAPGLLVSGLAVGLAMWKLRVSPLGILAFGLTLAMSRAFVDYTSSGLENPLGYLIVALLILTTGARAVGAPPKHALLRLTILASLLTLARWDLALLVAPTLAARWHGELRSRWRELIAGLGPLLAWLAFSTVYFGFPFPNTFYAKLGIGVPAGELVRHGWWYLEATLRRDPLTMVVIVAGLFWILLRGEREHRLWAVGILLYLAYVVRIGGDFMQGRFLAIPFWATCLLGATALTSVRRAAVLAAMAVLGLLVPGNPWRPLAGADAREWFHGVADERAFYGPNTGAWVRHGSAFTEHTFITAGRKARLEAEKRGGATDIAGSIGFYGYYAGPRLRIIDTMGLTDPFLARMAMAEPADGTTWRIGHFTRELPRGYVETVSTRVNRLEDPQLAQLYDDIRLITAGPLFAGERWRAIVRLNLGLD